MEAFVVRILAAVLAATLLAVVVSVLPELSANRNGQGEHLPVFKDESTMKLTRERVVDFILDQEIQMSLKRIDFYNYKVFLELDSAGLAKPAVSKELVRIICRMLEQTENVGEVQVLVHAISGESLLVEAKKSDLQVLCSPSINGIIY